MNSLQLLAMLLVAATVSSFQPTPITHQCKTPKHTSRLVPPRASAADNSPNSAMLRQIDQKIQRYERKQQKYQNRLQSAKAELEKYQQTKQRYLTSSSTSDVEASSANFSETTARSLVKSMMWRVIAGSVMFFTSLRFSNSISTALSIVGSDFFSKAFTMFIGERVMNKSQAGRKSGADDVGRSLAKALLWRLFAIANTLTMSWLIAKDLSMAGKIAGSDAVFKTGLMFVYERVWAKVEWGKEYIIEFSI
jgi:uncharacterized membrane protein